MSVLVEKNWSDRGSMQDDDWNLVDAFLTQATAFCRAQGASSGPGAIGMIAAVANLHERRGTQKSNAIALSLNLHAATLHHVDGYYNLGRVYADGLLDQQQDYSKDTTGSKIPRLQGPRGRLLCLGYLYENGLGETANSDKAKTWYLLAADLAHDQAAASLCNLLFSQPGKPPDYREARNWCELAIQVLPGDSHVQLALGSMYLNGWGGKTNKESAFKWLKHAADNGLPDAQFRLGYHLSTFLQMTRKPEATMSVQLSKDTPRLR